MCKMKEFARQICWGKRGEKSGKRKKKKEKIGEKRKIFHRMIFSGTVVVVSITHHFCSGLLGRSFLFGDVAYR